MPRPLRCRCCRRTRAAGPRARPALPRLLPAAGGNTGSTCAAAVRPAPRGRRSAADARYEVQVAPARAVVETAAAAALEDDRRAAIGLEHMRALELHHVGCIG